MLALGGHLKESGRLCAGCPPPAVSDDKTVARGGLEDDGLRYIPWKTLEPYRSDQGDLYGATVAENQLIQSTLAADSTLNWDFWRPGLPVSVTQESRVRVGQPGRAGLAKTVRKPGYVRTLPSLPTATEVPEYVLVGGAPLLPVFGDVREHLPGCVPICGVLHAVCFPELVWHCARILMAAEECDAIVATSRAGHRSMETALEAGAEKIARRLTCYAAAVARLRIVDIPLGTDLPAEEALNREHARSLLGLPAGAFCVLFIGRLTQGYKADLDVLLAVVARLAVSGRDVRRRPAALPPPAAPAPPPARRRPAPEF